MEFKELIAKRRSVRKFTDREVPREVVDRILAEALSAPSARNTRTTRFLVVDDPALVARMAEMRDYGSAFLKGAPLAVLVLGDTSASDLWRENAAISAHGAPAGLRRRRAGFVLGARQRTAPPQGRPRRREGRRLPPGLPAHPRRAANPSAPSPWAIPTSPPPRCRLRTTRRGFSGSDNGKGRLEGRPLPRFISV